MNAVRQAVWVFMTLVILACAGWYYASSEPITRLDKETLARTVDLTIYDLTAQQFDAKGQLMHRLQTPKLQHVPYDNTHELTTPIIKLTQPNQSPWEIKAQLARATNGGQRITFYNQVVIHQAEQDTTVTTDELTYYPDSKLAVTTKGIRLTRPGSVVESDGMRAYLSDNRMALSTINPGGHKHG